MASKQVETITVVSENHFDLKKRLGLPNDAEITSIEPVIVGGSLIRGVTITFRKKHWTTWLKHDGTWKR